MDLLDNPFLVAPNPGLVYSLNGVYQQHPRYRGILGHWLCTERGGTLFDWSGRGNHGTLVNADVDSFWGTRTQESSIAFDGTNDYINLGDRIRPTTEITISAWVYNTDHGTGADQDIIVRTGTTNTGNWAFEFNEAADPRPLFLSVGDNAKWVEATDADVSALNIWKHLCAVYKNGTGGSIYLNGQVKGTAGGSQNLGTAVMDLHMGGRPTGGDVMEGSLADIRIYDRALTAREVMSLYETPYLEFQWAFQQLMRRRDAFVAPAPGGLSIPVAQHGYRRRRVA